MSLTKLSLAGQGEIGHLDIMELSCHYGTLPSPLLHLLLVYGSVSFSVFSYITSFFSIIMVLIKLLFSSFYFPSTFHFITILSYSLSSSSILFLTCTIKCTYTTVLSWARIYKRLRSPGIDSKASIPPDFVAGGAGTSNRVFVPARQAKKRFPGLL
jgi:hypothetical protein